MLFRGFEGALLLVGEADVCPFCLCSGMLSTGVPFSSTFRAILTREIGFDAVVEVVWLASGYGSHEPTGRRSEIVSNEHRREERRRDGGWQEVAEAVF